MKSYRLKVENIIDETPEAYTLVFSAAEETVKNYKAGQYLTLKLNIEGENLRRAFSLSSSPLLDKHLAVTIKRVAGGKASNYLRDKVKVGDEIEVLPPMGNFAVTIAPENAKTYILMGAGSGITPLMSMLKTVLVGEAQSRVLLWYGNRNEENIIFKQELENLQQKYGNRLEVTHVLSQPSATWTGEKGRLDKMRAFKMLSDLFMRGDSTHKVYYMCGPNEMMQDLQAALHHQGVNAGDIHREYYSAPAPTDEEVAKVYESPSVAEGSEKVVQGAKVKLTLDGEVHEIVVPAGQYVLDAAIDAGIDPPYACQSGICTTCRAKVSKGKITMDESEGLSDQEIKEGYVLTCQSKCQTEEVELEYM